MQGRQRFLWLRQGGAMGQMAAGLFSGSSFRSSPANAPIGVIPVGLVEGILRGVLR